MKQIVGRYAPSPTGALHFGNLRTALIAWLHARLQGGKFLLRMEDLDQPRVVPGSAKQIIEDLKWLGIDWDSPIVYQSERNSLYQQALDKLISNQLVYECFCSRKDLREASSAPHGKSPIYPGTCRNLSNQSRNQRKAKRAPALRLAVGDTHITFQDGVLGKISQNLAECVGDFLVKRADGLFAYQLAVVADDLEQGITHVVRGADLADSTGRQIYLAQQLRPNAPAINYWHVPLKNDNQGKRMAKRDGSASAKSWRAAGKSSESLIGEFAFELCLTSSAEPLSAQQLLSQLSYEEFLSALPINSQAG